MSKPRMSSPIFVFILSGPVVSLYRSSRIDRLDVRYIHTNRYSDTEVIKDMESQIECMQWQLECMNQRIEDMKDQIALMRSDQDKDALIASLEEKIDNLEEHWGASFEHISYLESMLDRLPKRKEPS
jgi:TolA-binding protein